MQIVGLLCHAPGHEGGRVSNHVDFWFSTDTVLLFLTDVWASLKIQNKTLPCGIFLLRFQSRLGEVIDTTTMFALV